MSQDSPLHTGVKGVADGVDQVMYSAAIESVDSASALMICQPVAAPPAALLRWMLVSEIVAVVFSASLSEFNQIAGLPAMPV